LSQFSLFRAKNESSPFKKSSSLKWKIIEPFVEEGNSEQKYGFRVSHGDICRHFYTKSSEELDQWLIHLSKIGIMTDIKNDYTFKKVLGTGSFAHVYLAVDVENNQEYAIKSIQKALIQSKSNFMALVNEIDILRSLNHPTITKLHKVYESPHHIHLVLDYAPGGDLLHRILNKGPFSEEKAAKLIKNILKVLEYLESKNIAHRDIKLENILMMSDDNDNKIKITDFGLASLTTTELTQNCGSPGYVAPEILKKKPYGSKVDVFSVGVVLYIILSGRAPFAGKNPRETLIKNRDCAILFYDEYWKNISRQAINAVLYLTRSQPKIRPSAKEALEHEWFLKYCEDVKVPLRKTSSAANIFNAASTSPKPTQVLIQEMSRTRRSSCLANGGRGETQVDFTTRRMSCFINNTKGDNPAEFTTRNIAVHNHIYIKNAVEIPTDEKKDAKKI